MDEAALLMASEESLQRKLSDSVDRLRESQCDASNRSYLADEEDWD